MNFAKSTESTQISLLGELDRVEHRPHTVAATGAQRWTTRDQVAQLLARPEIRALWPKGDYVAADPCAGIGQLMRHVDDLLGGGAPRCARARGWQRETGRRSSRHYPVARASTGRTMARTRSRAPGTSGAPASSGTRARCSHLKKSTHDAAQGVDSARGND